MEVVRKLDLIEATDLLDALQLLALTLPWYLTVNQHLLKFDEFSVGSD